MPNTASASVSPEIWAMPKSSRVMLTLAACARQLAISCGGAAAMRRRLSGRTSGRMPPCTVADDDEKSAVAGAFHHSGHRHRCRQRSIAGSTIPGDARGRLTEVLGYQGAELVSGFRTQRIRLLVDAAGELFERGRQPLQPRAIFLRRNPEPPLLEDLPQDDTPPPPDVIILAECNRSASRRALAEVWRVSRIFDDVRVIERLARLHFAVGI